MGNEALNYILIDNVENDSTDFKDLTLAENNDRHDIYDEWVDSFPKPPKITTILVSYTSSLAGLCAEYTFDYHEILNQFFLELNEIEKKGVRCMVCGETVPTGLECKNRHPERLCGSCYFSIISGEMYKSQVIKCPLCREEVTFGLDQLSRNGTGKFDDYVDTDYVDRVYTNNILNDLSEFNYLKPVLDYGETDVANLLGTTWRECFANRLAKHLYYASRGVGIYHRWDDMKRIVHSYNE